MKGTADRLNAGIGGRGYQGKCVDPGSEDLSFVFASAKNQLYDLGSNLWTSISSSVHGMSDLSSTFQCVNCYPERGKDFHIKTRHTHIHKHMHTHMTETIASQNNT